MSQLKMPELPEVQTIVAQLYPAIIGKKITNIERNDARIVDAKLKTTINGTISDISRRGKAIIISLDRKKCLFIRLGMTGHFYYNTGKERKPQPHQVANFIFHDNSSLSFHDTRRFGSLKVLGKKQLHQQLQKFGPEPLDNTFTLARFDTILEQKKNSIIKTTLMDQKVIAGIGNIYAQEALYRSGIDPRRKIGTLSAQEITLLRQEIRKTLHAAIKHNGTSFSSFLHLDGSGGFQEFLTVYQKEKCPKHHLLKKIYLGSRGTWYCPKCQK